MCVVVRYLSLINSSSRTQHAKQAPFITTTRRPAPAAGKRPTVIMRRYCVFMYCCCWFVLRFFWLDFCVARFACLIVCVDDCDVNVRCVLCVAHDASFRYALCE